MANVIEIAKAAITAYNEKDWSKGKEILAADAVYDEKGTNRRIQGAGEIIEAWQDWAKAFPDSKATFVRERGYRGPRACVERHSHGPITDTNRYHSAIEQVDPGACLPSRPSRRW